MNRPLLLLAALTFCCCIASLHGYRPNNCRCRQPSKKQIPHDRVKKIEMIPVSGHCRRTEIIITTPGEKICVHPDSKWLPDLLKTLQKKQESSTFQPPAASTPSA